MIYGFPCKCGVSQGSVLGLLFFLIYINDTTAIANSTEMIMYADDTTVFFTALSKQSLENSVNNFLNDLSFWLKFHRLDLNSNKAKYVICKPINKPNLNEIQISFNRRLLEQVKVQKFLRGLVKTFPGQYM